MDTRVTQTAAGDQHPGARAAEDIIGLELLVTGRRFVFPPRRWIVVGAAPEVDLVIDDPLVSARHCMIERRGLRRLIVQDCRSKNGTWIDDSSVDVAELPFTGVLVVGATTMVPYTASGPGGRTLEDFLRAQVRAYGSVRRAARALRIPKSTLGHWLRTGRRS